MSVQRFVLALDAAIEVDDSLTDDDKSQELNNAVGKVVSFLKKKLTVNNYSIREQDNDDEQPFGVSEVDCLTLEELASRIEDRCDVLFMVLRQGDDPASIHVTPSAEAGIGIGTLGLKLLTEGILGGLMVEAFEDEVNDLEELWREDDDEDPTG